MIPATRSSTIAVAIILAWTVMGCGGKRGGIDGGGIDGGGQIALDDLCDDFMQALCDYRGRCWDMYQPCGAEPTCHQIGLPQLVCSVEAGHVAYDAKAAVRCIDFLHNAHCLELAWIGFGIELFDKGTWKLYRDCDDTFDGLLAEDEDCYSDAECLQGLRCDREQGCPGRCLPLEFVGGGEGEVGVEGVCRQGLVCDGGTCRWAKRKDSPCASNEGCMGCLECYQSICSSAPGVMQNCREITCGPHWDVKCDTGLFCDEGTCMQRRSVGQGCGDSRECESMLFCRGDTGVCSQRIQAGGQCAGAEKQECGLDLHCDMDSYTCEPYPGLGEPCLDSEELKCSPEFICDAENDLVPGICVEREERTCDSYLCR